MGRIGNRNLQLEAGININIKPNLIILSKGNNIINIPNIDSFVKVENNNGVITTKCLLSNEKKAIVLHGTINSLIKNAIIGLTTPYIKKLKIVGVGYKAALASNKLTLNIGLSHPVVLDIPKEIIAQVPTNVEINLSSYDKAILGEFAAKIRSFKKPEPYKGKGIMYSDEVIIRKVGKTAEGAKK